MWGLFWFYWPMFGTGIGVAMTGIVLLGIGGVFGVEWERREVDKYLARRGR
jgi:two-component system LytT family sensor kinase